MKYYPNAQVIGERRSRIPVSYVSESSDEASLANLEGNCTPTGGEGETGMVWDDVPDLDMV